MTDITSGNVSTANYTDTSISLFARSAFALAFVGLVATVVIAPFLTLAPARGGARVVVGVGCCVVIIAALGLCAYLLRVSPEELSNSRIEKWMSRPIVASVLTLLVIEANALSFPIINGVAPSIRLASLLLLMWSVIALTALALANRDNLTRWYDKLRPAWTSLGLTLTLLLVVGAIYGANRLLLDTTGVIDTLRGGLDYRELVFFGGETDTAMSQQYWQELSAIRGEWLPYVYWRIGESDGDLININAAGVRQTVNFVESSSGVPEIFFFGGSTLWGEGARDAYTIPSQVAALLNDAGQPAHVTNYGQTAYVSTQDMILFQMQLVQGNVPDVAVFYQGFNDLATLQSGDIAGIPHNEVNRLADFEAGRRLREGGLLLRQPDVSLTDIDMTLVTEGRGTAAAVVDRFFANVDMLSTIAAGYGVEVVVVWQPTIIHKQTLTAHEQAFLDENRDQWAEFETLYAEADALVRERVADYDKIVVISDLFADEESFIFFDRVHIIEDGNYAVAQAILPAITDAIDTSQQD